MNNECPYNALKAAVQKIGGQSAMARLISTTIRPIRQGHIWMWLNRNKKLPPEFVLTVEAATGISRYALRPDIFGPFPQAPLSHAADAGVGCECTAPKVTLFHYQNCSRFWYSFVLCWRGAWLALLESSCRCWSNSLRKPAKSVFN